MAERIDVGVRITGTEKVTSDLTKVNNKTKGLGESVNMASGALDKMTGGALTAFQGIVGGVKKAIIGIKGFRSVVISTGIGALVVAVGSLVAYFTQTQKGAEKLEIAMAGVKIIFAKLTDVASTLGEKIIWVFTEPEQAIKDLWGTIKTYFIDKFHEVVKSVGLLGSAFVKLFNRDFSGALADATEGAKGLFMELTPLGVAIETVGAIVENVTPLIGEFVNEVNDAVDAATKLSNRSIQLRKDQRDLALGFAEGRAQIKEYNLVAEDVTQTLEDRLVAAQKAIDIEKALMTERQRLAQEEVDIQKANMALSKNVEADQQKLVDLEVALINIRTESAEMQTTLGNKLNIINAQAAAEKATQMKTFLDGLETMGKAEEEATLLRLKNLKVVADAEKATADAVRAARLGIVSAGFDALKSMAKTEEGQKRLAISQILVNQGVAMSQAIAGATTSATALGPGAFVATPLFIAQALGLVLGSFASIKGVMNQAGASSGSVGTSSGGGGGGASAQLALTPTLESFEGDTLELPAVQAYVLQNNIADADALAQALQNQSSL
jgi:predicted  nucleic acid-binding Zn-ribbon protein